jgi:tRNA dimethylallyltransferase
LRTLDPKAADAILPSNGRRIARALEVIEVTGRPFTASMPRPESVYDTITIALDRTDLDERVEHRVHHMMELGWLEEIRALLPAGLRGSPTAGKALGYQQLMTALDDAGNVVGDLAACVQETIMRTKRFVRRQRRWFRRDARITWLDAADPTLLARAIEVARLRTL